jgi:hypothetical protein
MHVVYFAFKGHYIQKNIYSGDIFYYRCEMMVLYFGLEKSQNVSFNFWQKLF